MASTSGPSNSDIEAVFHRLRAQATNKVLLLQFQFKLSRIIHSI